MTTDAVYLGIDLGGTNAKAGVVTADGTVVSKTSVPTEAARGPGHGIEQMALAAERALENAQCTTSHVRAVGLATPGTMDIPGGLLLDPPNLPGWENFPVRQRIADRLGLPTILQNDANAAAYGEYWVGSARDADSLVFYTLGTGLGGGIIIHDQIVEGQHSHGSECGHVILESHGGRLCSSGQYGTAEAYCSATALLKAFRDAAETGRDSVVLERINDSSPLTPILIGQAAEEGDELCVELIDEMARYLGCAITSVVHVIDPTVVLLGGAMTFGRETTTIGRRFLETVRAEFRHRAFPTLGESVGIHYAELGGDAGFIGAAGCAKRAVTNNSLQLGSQPNQP